MLKWLLIFMSGTASWKNCGTAKLLAFPIPSRQFILKIKFQEPSCCLAASTDTHVHTHKLGFVWDVCIISYVTYYFQNIHHFMNLCLCCLTCFLCSAEMTLLLLLNLFWIYTKRRSCFFRQTCQCFKLYALNQICIDLWSSSLHHGYATVVHSWLRYKRILLS